MTHNKPIPYKSGQQYWISDGDRFFSPQALSSLGLPEYVDRIDDAFVWGKNEKTYFFYKNLYWRYNEVTKVCIKLYISYAIVLNLCSINLMWLKIVWLIKPHSKFDRMSESVKKLYIFASNLIQTLRPWTRGTLKIFHVGEGCLETSMPYWPQSLTVWPIFSKGMSSGLLMITLCPLHLTVLEGLMDFGHLPAAQMSEMRI